MVNKNQDFSPPFCPNPECRFHHEHALDKKWFTRYSSYFSRKENRYFQRFMCLGCNKTFSERTFASDYWLNLDLKYSRLFAGLRKGIGLVQWAEVLGHSVSVIENRLKRLGRWLVCRGFVTAQKILQMQGLGLVRLGLFLKRFWVMASHPEHGDMLRCFLKELRKINNVVAVEVWTLLSWCYWLGYDYFYRPVFTYY